MIDHIALLGDSILDNSSYTNGLPDVATHLRRMVPETATVTLVAVDGSKTTDIEAQVDRLPTGVTCAVLSLGGNDAILEMDALDLPISSTGEALGVFGERASLFEGRYRAALEAVLECVPRTIVCTIYNPRLDEGEAAITRVGLMFLNDAILRIAFERRLSVIDLRLICVEPADFANPLEPSSQGAAKIAKAIVAAVDPSADWRGASRVVSG